MSNILLTGFEPFAGHGSNPSQQIVAALDGQTIGGATIFGLTMPVVYGEDTSRIFPAIAELRPSLVLCLGLHAGTPCIDVERFAVNLRYSPSGDGSLIPIIPDGPGGYLATINPEAVSRAIQVAGVPARPHEHAGTYLCNHILYQTLHYAATQNLTYQGGFLHLPLSTEQVVAEKKPPQPSLPLDQMITGVGAALASVLAA